MSQKMVAKQSKYKKELAEFRERMDDAKKEGNNMLGRSFDLYDFILLCMFSAASFNRAT